ncbi:MBL fold metallo-hydrolase [Rhodobacteraceae bacterium NNCM2]|nr:MBL fold metallo-hydrolase [Coraliihabitans acroporae]
MNAPLLATGITFPWDEPPAPGEVIEVAEGILWARLPLPMKLDHVNIYALDDGDGWTLIDTGMNWKKGVAEMEALLAGPLAAKPVTRVLMTHSHPDHLGQVGLFAGRGAEVIASRSAWLMGRMMTLDRHERHPPQNIAFRRRAGMSGEALAAYAEETPFNFADCVVPIPIGFTRLQEGDRFHAGGRDWLVRMGEGHAIEHVTLWTDEILIAGDQVIPGISPNIGVYPSEPEANPLKAWIDSCERFRALGADPLVLPGHKLPFRGLDFRLSLMIENHTSAFDRIEAALEHGPLTAVGMMPAVFRREIRGSQFGLALVEAVAHANYLHQAGRVTRTLNENGAWEYRRAAT